MELSNRICLWPEWTNHGWHFNRRLLAIIISLEILRTIQDAIWQTDYGIGLIYFG